MEATDARKRAAYFSAALRKRLGANLRQVILFGSRARGDFREGSDYDFAVVVRRKDPSVQSSVVEAGVDFLNRFDEVSACVVYDETEWAESTRLPLGVNIKREGIAL